MKSRIKKIASLSIALMLGVSAMAGCAAKKDNAVSKKTENTVYTSETYAFVGKDMQNTYMQKVYEGFKTSCSEIGVNAVYSAPESQTAEQQAQIIRDLINKKVTGIAVAANDADALEDVLSEAMDAGIKVISLDSAVNKDSRQLHIQQADPEEVGRSLIRAAYDIIGGEGGIAILSTTEQATNQNLWIKYMHEELDENPEKYASTPLISTVYGDDDLMKSKTETQSLIENPDIKIIIAPTSVGISAASEVLQNSSNDVRITGLGMPSQIAEYIEGGICPEAYLWNPSDIGYLAGYALKSISDEQITGSEGDTFYAGHLGTKTVTAARDGGTEIMLGDLLKFDSSNISEWKNEF